MENNDFRATGLALAIMSALPDNAASSAAAAAASAAEAKAVQESIPEDYTTLSNDVDDLKSAVEQDKKNFTHPSGNLWTSKWERGSLAWATGATAVDNNALRTKDFMDVKPSTKYAYYDARDWGKAQNDGIAYIGQYLFEYDASGTFIKYTTLYTTQFQTGETTYKIKFRSGSFEVFAALDINGFNAQPFQLVEGSTYFTDAYKMPDLLDEPDYPLVGVQSDNLFDGTFTGFINQTNGLNSPITTSVRFATGLIHAPKAVYPDLYFTVFGYSGSYWYSGAVCYDASKVYIGYVSLTTVSTSVFGNVVKFTPAAGTEYVVLYTADLTKNEANTAAANALKEASRTKLFVTGSIDKIYANCQINGTNKIGRENVTLDFLDEVRNNNIRDFMLTGLKSYVNDLMATGYDAMIAAMTDLHAVSYEPYAVINYMADSGAVDLAINLGDSIPDHYDTKAEASAFLRDRLAIQHKFATKAPVFNAIGNHDVNPVNGDDIPDGTNMLHTDELYTLSMGRLSPGIMSGKCYGYYDLVNAKIRVIVLNTSDIYGTDGTPLIDGYNTAIQQEQFEWFANVALDFSDKKDADEWAVITMAHDRLTTVGGTGAPFDAVITALTTGGSATASGSRTVDGYTFTLNATVDYTSQGAVEYIGHICGHSHDDNMTTIATNYKQVEIPCAVLTAHYYDNGVKKDYTRTKGTTEELLFDTVCIDRANKTVKMKRFGGVGSDRTFTYGS